MDREEILNQIKHTRCEDEGTVYIENRLRRNSTKGMMLCLVALIFYSTWADTAYYDLSAVFWMYAGISMFTAYRIGKMKSYFIIAVLQFSIAAYSAYMYIKTTWPIV